MSMTGFTAEAALYKASGHYRTGRQALYLPRRTNSAIYPARDEVIEVVGCRSGYIELGEGVCIRDPSWGGGGPYPPDVPDEPSGEGPHGPGGGGSGSGQPPKADKPTPGEKTGKAWRRRCAIEHYENPEKILECCDKKLGECFKEAKGDAGREMVCSTAHSWCRRPDGGGYLTTNGQTGSSSWAST